MKNFMDEEFLLNTETAQFLYHNYAEKLPVIDYHCHLSPADIASDRVFENVTQIWLNGDHYKWRAMRSLGIAEKFITGDADDYTKFRTYLSCLPYLVGNPLYHWSHLEMKRFFGVEGPLNGDRAEELWNVCNAKLSRLSARTIITMANVDLLCTTDDPADTLDYHLMLKADESFKTKVLPAFRPDKGFKPDAPWFADYLKQLGDAAHTKIVDFDSLVAAYKRRVSYFDDLGCRTADHGFYEKVTFDKELSDGQRNAIANVVIKRVIAGDKIDPDMVKAYRDALIVALCEEYAAKGWVMQIHFGVLRDVNPVMFGRIGADAGCDTPNTAASIPDLAAMLSVLRGKNILPKTILYSGNSADNAALASLIGCFQENLSEENRPVPNMQQGSAWWFNDSIMGMRNQLETLASEGALSTFVGMLTDSRSLLSYARHEYFRRILCNMIGGYVLRGEYPQDVETLAQIVCDVCYNNTKDFFGFEI
ncbi:MAG: glucuronate isomerase [Clostridia bacterium]|nr:glucuronate isomerase [Clostridia bacterium]